MKSPLGSLVLTVNNQSGIQSNCSLIWSICLLIQEDGPVKIYHVRKETYFVNVNETYMIKVTIMSATICNMIHISTNYLGICPQQLSYCI